MTGESPGLYENALAYWQGYTSAFVSCLLIFGLAGSVIWLGSIYLYPAASTLILISVVSLVAHFAALYVRDVWTGEYNPEQTQITSAASVFLTMYVATAFAAAFIIVGVVAGTVASAAPIEFPYFAAMMAAYYPVIDILLIRRGMLTPAGVVLGLIMKGSQKILNVQQSMIESIPVISNTRRPQV